MIKKCDNCEVEFKFTKKDIKKEIENKKGETFKLLDFKNKKEKYGLFGLWVRNRIYDITTTYEVLKDLYNIFLTCPVCEYDICLNNDGISTVDELEIGYYVREGCVKVIDVEKKKGILDQW